MVSSGLSYAGWPSSCKTSPVLCHRDCLGMKDTRGPRCRSAFMVASVLAHPCCGFHKASVAFQPTLTAERVLHMRCTRLQPSRCWERKESHFIDHTQLLTRGRRTSLSSAGGVGIHGLEEVREPLGYCKFKYNIQVLSTHVSLDRRSSNDRAVSAG